MLTAKFLIYLSLILALGLGLAVELQDGDQVVFRTRGSFYNANYQYLNANTANGSVGMAAGYDTKNNLASRWIAHLLSDGIWAFQNFKSPANSQYTYLNADTYIGAVNLAGSTDYSTTSGTHWAGEALSDGTFALKNLGSFKNPQYQYLNANTHDGSINLAANTDYKTASGTHWYIHIITDPNDQGGFQPQTGTMVGSMAQPALPPSS